ncbi:MAG: hypothetical protein IJ242_13015 [Clostridia bacterium]|nr:hypothetical protein [Clostridia bacterium]
MNRQHKWSIGTLFAHLTALILAVGVAAFFYGFMVYQGNPEDGTDPESTMNLVLQDLMPPDGTDITGDVPRIILNGAQYVSGQRSEGMVHDKMCVQIVDNYLMSDGRQVQAVTAWPQGYMEGFLGSDWKPQKITGFTIGALPATFYLGSSGSMIAAREEPFIYIIRVLGEDPDGQTVYALGVQAEIQEQAGQ